MWTLFWDMHSGGRAKEAPYEKIYIEAPEEEAKVIFYNRFGHSPERVSCTCCGEDYAVSESETLEQASAYHRNCAHNKNGYIEKQDTRLKQYLRRGESWEAYLECYPHTRYCTVQEYEEREDVLFIRKADIKPEERKGELPQEGYVWV